VLHKNSKSLADLDPSLNKTLPLNITFSPISLGKWRVYQQMERSLEATKIQWGFGDAEIDQIKQLFCYTNHLLLAATLTVSILHTLFSFLAMKNDIMYWRKRDSMLGLSASQIVFEFVASYVIFFYLLDSDQGNKIVNFLCGCECLIATWKVLKMIRMRRSKRTRSSADSNEADDDDDEEEEEEEGEGEETKASDGSGNKNAINGANSEALDAEALTSKYDWLAIKYLGSVMIPCVVAYCIYSLLYEPHKSLLSWMITSMASVVYAVGFILMTPQLFINYKLKSVAHLPWRTLTYKAFNTFVDDLFSLVIDMPILHRLACFRDDIVFFIFLYQWWIYGADKKRSYEYDSDADDEIDKDQEHEEEPERQLSAGSEDSKKAKSSKRNVGKSPSVRSSATKAGKSRGKNKQGLRHRKPRKHAD